MPFDAGSDQAVAVMYCNVISEQVSEMNKAKRSRKAQFALSNIMQAVATKSEMPVVESLPVAESSPSARRSGCMGFRRCSMASASPTSRRGTSAKSSGRRSREETTSRQSGESAPKAHRPLTT